MKNLTPILMKPYLKDAIWGGTNLIDVFGREAKTPTLAESWELSDFPGCMSYAVNGAFKGRSFGDIRRFLELEKDSVLIKLIDSDADLSVQVHPSVASANALPKNECWYIIDAEEDAQIAYGLKEPLSEDELVASVENGSISDKLNFVNVKPGDFFYVPAGLIHAIGKGVTLVEIQQTSDTTYRLYDYDRRDANGNPRELHIEKAAKAFRNFSSDEINSYRFRNSAYEKEPNCLCDNEFFTACSFMGESFLLDYREEECAIVFLGDGVIRCDDEVIPVTFGQTYYIPPKCKCIVEADFAVLTVF
jgi:mannose-6-phosphate isomerase